MMSRLLILLIIVVAIAGCTTKENGAWENWRGPNHNGTVSNVEWAPASLDSTKIVWTKEIGAGHSSILVREGLVYSTGWELDTLVNDSVGQTSIYCLDLETGDEVWKYSYPAGKRSFPGPRSTPTIDEDKIYQLSWEGVLICIDLATGTEIWKKDIVSDSTTLRDYWGCSTSPVIFENMILLNQNKSGMAFDKTTGDLIWTSDKHVGSMTSTSFVELGETAIGTFKSDSVLYLVDVKTGDIVAEHHSTSKKTGWIDAIVLSDSTMYLGCEFVTINNDQIESVWQNDTISSFFTVGGVIDGYAYQIGSYGRRKTALFCIEVATGNVAWSESIPQYGATTYVDDNVVLLDGMGLLRILQATPEAYTEISTLQVLPKHRKKGCWTMPTIVDGKVLVRNSTDTMVCIDLSI